MPETKLSAFVAGSIKKLKTAGIDNPDLDARLLIGDALGLDRADIFSQSDHILKPEEIAQIQTYIARRLKHESVARIIGEREFWSLPFGLNEATLEPRPDSETLIEVALSKNKKQELSIFDLGAGTGCLLLSLLHELPKATGLGIDIAPRAVEQAQKNATRLGLEGRAKFQMNNWADGITEKFDIVISNPPYIAHEDIAGLMPEVGNYDPVAALDGGEEGLEVYHFLIPQLSRLLKPQGFAIFEVGIGQAKTVGDIFKKNGFTEISTHRDLSGIERCVVAYIP